jgi:hypothetical protein
VIEWSIDRLSGAAKTCLLHVAVFNAGWTVEEVAESLGWSDQALDAVSELMESSLVQRMESDERPRFRTLESVRAIALERLAASGNEAATRDSHLRAYCLLAEDLHRRIPYADTPRYLHAFSSVAPNLIAAMQWAAVRESVDDLGHRLAASLAVFLAIRGRAHEGAKLYRDILVRNDPFGSRELEAAVYLAYGRIQWHAGDDEGGRDSILASLQIFEELGKAREANTCHSQLGAIGVTRCDLDFAQYHYKQTTEGPASDQYRGRGLIGLSIVANVKCEFDEGVRIGLLAAEGLIQDNDERHSMHARTVTAECAVRLGLDLATTEAQRAYDYASGCGEVYVMGFALHVLAEVAREHGNMAVARQLCDELIDARDLFGDRRTMAMARCLSASLAWLEGDLAKALKELDVAEATTAGDYRWISAVGFDVTKFRVLSDLGQTSEADKALLAGLTRRIPVWRDWATTDLLLAFAERCSRFGGLEGGELARSSAVAFRKSKGWVWFADARRSGLTEAAKGETAPLEAAVALAVEQLSQVV